MRALQSSLATLAAAGMLAAVSTPADAKCTRLAFSVNDYGKEGPARDARNLLDKYIATHMKERGIAKYTVGKKDVTCELFIDLGFFDEYTCKAAATVCWGDRAKGATDAKAPADGEPARRKAGGDGAPAAAEAPAAAPAPARAAAPSAPAPVTTGSIPAPAAPPAKKSE